MKKIILIMSVAVLFFVSCDNHKNGALTSIAFEPTMTRTQNYGIEKYLEVSDVVTIIKDNTNEFTYKYVDGLLVGKDEANTIFYNSDNSTPIASIEYSWPIKAERETLGASISKDQTSKDVFMKNDWISGTLTKVKPTQILPIAFKHERMKITFTLGGDYQGKRIESLEIGPYKAYCDSDLKDAQLIYTADEYGNLVIGTMGTVKIEGVDLPKSVILATSPEVIPAAEVPGKNYTIVFAL